MVKKHEPPVIEPGTYGEWLTRLVATVFHMAVACWGEDRARDLFALYGRRPSKAQERENAARLVVERFRASGMTKAEFIDSGGMGTDKARKTHESNLDHWLNDPRLALPHYNVTVDGKLLGTAVFQTERKPEKRPRKKPKSSK